jgi:hypothetical protein
MWKRLLVFLLCAGWTQAQPLLQLQGSVRDTAGKYIPGATVRLVPQNGEVQTTRTDRAGRFFFGGVLPAVYAIEVEATGFVPFTEPRLTLLSDQSFDVRLMVTAPKAQVTVIGRRLSVEPDNNVSATTLRTPDLRGLPDSPDDFVAALQALAGPSVLGLGGPQIFVNNMIRHRLPPKTAIREVHIDRIPFSAQYDRPGVNRIDVFTRAGGPTFTGETYFGITDARLNARNPFTKDDPPHQLRLLGANLGGPIIRERLFFSAAVERTEADSVNSIDATILDDSLTPVRFRSLVDTPERRITSTIRLDQNIGPQNLLSVRYEGLQADRQQHSQDPLALPETLYRTPEKEHAVQMRHTATITPQVMNEARLQYESSRKRQLLQHEGPAIQVPGAFSGGGASVGSGLKVGDRWEVQNNLVVTHRNHGIRIGGRVRRVFLNDFSTENFGGVYKFDSGIGPPLNTLESSAASSQSGASVQLTSLERYRRTLMLLKAGMPAADVRALGGGASQLTLVVGDGLSRIRQLDLGAFIHNDWRARPGLTLSYGLRFETQSNVRRSRDFAPRLSVAWMPSGSNHENPSIVVRAGWGLFYDRIGEDALLESRRGADGLRRFYDIQDPALLNAFPGLPAPSDNWPEPQVIRRVAGDLRAPATMQSMLAVERQVRGRTTVSVSFTHARVWHALRARVLRPSEEWNTSIYRLDSDARLTERRLAVNVSHQAGSKLNWTAKYVMGRSFSDSDGPNSITYDPRFDYGRSSKDVHHSLTVTGAFALPFRVQLSPFVVASSGRPFDIYLAEKAPGGVALPVRPAWAVAPGGHNALATQFGVFDLNPPPGQPVIPRNLGSGPAFLSVNLKLAKSFALARAAEGAQMQEATAQKQAARVTLSVQAVNLLNRVNPGPLTGDLRSPQFGQATTLADGFNFGGRTPVANRRLELQVRVQF